jgi:hypothetical protein
MHEIRKGNIVSRRDAGAAQADPPVPFPEAIGAIGQSQVPILEVLVFVRALRTIPDF